LYIFIIKLLKKIFKLINLNNRFRIKHVINKKNKIIFYWIIKPLEILAGIFSYTFFYSYLLSFLLNIFDSIREYLFARIFYKIHSIEMWLLMWYPYYHSRFLVKIWLIRLKIYGIYNFFYYRFVFRVLKLYISTRYLYWMKSLVMFFIYIFFRLENIYILCLLDFKNNDLTDNIFIMEIWIRFYNLYIKIVKVKFLCDFFMWFSGTFIGMILKRGGTRCKELIFLYPKAVTMWFSGTFIGMILKRFLKKHKWLLPLIIYFKIAKYTLIILYGIYWSSFR